MLCSVKMRYDCTRYMQVDHNFTDVFICKALLLQPKQSRVRLIMSHRPKKIVLFSVYSGTVYCSRRCTWSRWEIIPGGRSGDSKTTLPYVDVLVQGTIISMQSRTDETTTSAQCWQRQEYTFLPDKMELHHVHTVDDGTQLVRYSLPDITGSAVATALC